MSHISIVKENLSQSNREEGILYYPEESVEWGFVLINLLTDWPSE